MKERLHKYMAKCGVASRRKCEELVFTGCVKVNGSIVREIVMVDDQDLIEVDGMTVRPEENKVYILLHKPTDIITSVQDQFQRKTVMDLVEVQERVFPVGRLDYDTSGALLLTNDGDLAFQMTHPSHELDKTYEAVVIGTLTARQQRQFEEGIDIEDYRTAPATIKLLKEEKDFSTVQITIHEGRNRQIRKMCEKIGHPVVKLKRIRIGKIGIDGLKPGEWRHLTPQEVEYLKAFRRE